MVESYLFPKHYLEHLYSLRVGHVNRLMSWVRLYGESSVSIHYVCV